MLRFLLAAGIVAGVMVAGGADLSACGDKYFRPGKSSRMKNYASIYPASILIVKGPNASEEGLSSFQRMLKQAGHTSRVVSGEGLLVAVAGGTHDLVFANYDVAASIERSLQTVAGHPDVVPVISKPTNAVVAEARGHFAAVIVAKMDFVDALQEIDRLMKTRRALVDVSGFK
jgi:hypothetical protein